MQYGNLIILEEFTAKQAKELQIDDYKTTSKRVRCKCLSCNRDDYYALKDWVVNSKVKTCGCQLIESRYLGPTKALRNKVVDQYKRNATKRKIRFNLNDEKLDILFNSNCAYCGSPPSMTRRHIKSIRDKGGLRSKSFFTYNGIDRLINSKGYSNENCVSCCDRCNKFKNNQDYGEFLEHAASIVLSLEKIPFYRRVEKPEDNSDTQKALIKSGTRLAKGEAAFNALYSTYKRWAKKKKYSFSLTKKEFFNLTQQACYYCQLPPIIFSKIEKTFYGGYIHNGIDRFDNNLGYHINNCVPCCKYCNRAKNNFQYDDFIKHVNKIFMHQLEYKIFHKILEDLTQRDLEEILDLLNNN